ncbi:MAG: hypothetical protein MUP45_02265 [Candidatus Marinimicrobia bacterium]|nr:hypothetical protein [Candidatus Neomarinimicrobiota bacterium]
MAEQEEEKEKELTPEQSKTRWRGILAIIVTWILFFAFVRWQNIEGPALWALSIVPMVVMCFFARAVNYAISSDQDVSRRY